MTEEEKAEEYANKAHTHAILQWEKIKQAYLAGLHEGQSQLVEAKEIINELLLANTRKGSEWTGYLLDLKERAEQFIGEGQ